MIILINVHDWYEGKMSLSAQKKSADVKKRPSIGTPGANQVEYKHIRISTDLPCVRATATVVSVCCLKVPYIHGN